MPRTSLKFGGFHSVDEIGERVWAGVHGVAHLWRSQLLEARYHEIPDEASPDW